MADLSREVNRTNGFCHCSHPALPGKEGNPTLSQYANKENARCQVTCRLQFHGQESNG